MQNNSTCSIVAIVVNHSLLVCTTRAKNLRNFFRPYFFGNDGLTGPYVRSGATPALYLLESLDNSTRIQATSARIAWTHLLHNHGYQIINENALTQPLHPNDQQKLGQISSTYDLEALLHPNRELSQNFHYAPPRTYRVAFPVSPERHQELLDAARDLDMTLQDYCQAQFDLRMIQRPTLSELRACTKRILFEAETSVFRQYQAFFLDQGIQLQLSSKRVEQLIDEALALGTGARPWARTTLLNTFCPQTAAAGRRAKRRPISPSSCSLP